MHHGGNLYNRLRTRRAAVISSPFAERTFDLFRSPHALAFQDDFRRGRNRQTGEFTADHVHGLALNTADKVVLTDSVRHLEGAGQKNQRIVADGNRYLEGFASGKCLVPMNSPMPSRRDIEADGVLVMNHHTRTAEIGPAFFGIMCDVYASRADVPAAVQFKPPRRRESQNIHISSALNVFQHRSIAYHARGEMLQLLRPTAPFRNKFHGAQILRHAEAQTEPLGRSQRIDQNAITLRITFHGVEQHRRRAAPFVDDVRDTADFQIPIGPLDGANFAEPIGLLEPTSQTVWLFHDSSLEVQTVQRFARFKPFKSNSGSAISIGALNGLNLLNDLNDLNALESLLRFPQQSQIQHARQRGFIF